MRNVLSRWLKANSAIFINTGSLIGAMGVTSVLGFVYWWLAAREFAPQDVGIASASISAMTLLGTIGMMGLGTLLITELPRQPDQAGSLISTALIVVGVVGAGVGFLFALVAPSVSIGFQPLRASIITIVLFAVGVSLTSITLVLDQAVIGLLRGGVQLWRNSLFALGKLVALFLISRWLSVAGGIGVYGAWAVGNGLSLIVLAGWMILKGKWSGRSYWPQKALLRKLGAVALQHHLLNLTLSAPPLLLPLMVTVLLSARANAWFYVAWMVASFLFMVPGALTIVLHAINSAEQETLKHKARVTLSLSFVIGLFACVVMLFGAKYILSLFGGAYAAEASWTLSILTLAFFPLTIKNHYIAICRIQDRIARAMMGMAPGGLLELGGAALGAHLGGLVGLGVGWVIALCFQSIPMLPTIYKTVFLRPPLEQQSMVSVESISLIDTYLLPVVRRVYTEPELANHGDASLQSVMHRSHIIAEVPWLMNTLSLPVVTLPAGQILEKPKGKGLPSHNGGSHDHIGKRLRLKPSRLEPLGPYSDGMPGTFDASRIKGRNDQTYDRPIQQTQDNL